MWHGTAASVVDLHPAGFKESTADAVSGNSQVGTGYLTVSVDDARALLWQGTAASVVNLHPAGFVSSAALGVDGNTQVGFAMTDDGMNNAVSRAIMWQGTAASFVNLHPASGYKQSRVEDVAGNTQVGSAITDGVPNPVVPQHAMLWHGTAGSFVDLHPAGYSRSNALGAAGDLQVGHGLPVGSTLEHALIWNGTAGSVVDLHATLAGMSIDFVESFAFDVDANGSIVGIARDSRQNSYAILWKPVPEPGTGMLLICGLIGAACVARRHSLTGLKPIRAAHLPAPFARAAADRQTDARRAADTPARSPLRGTNGRC